ncbi:hypothetical protein [Eoetvoesiella caeni]
MSMYEAFTQEDFESTFAPYVKLAADDVTKLRFCDVDRVMGQARNDDELIAITEYLLTARKDFDVAELCEVEGDVRKDKGWK